MAAASDDGNWRFVPDPWKADPDMSQDMFAPSNATKEAAKLSFITAEVQQATGWLLLTHFGIILGSFGPTMSRSAFWLSWSIFILEAISKFVRSYIHNHCFRDVPCAYVPFHKQYVPFASGLYAGLGVTLVEPCLYLPSWILFIEQWKTHRHCGSGGCPQDGVQRLDEFLLAACVITFCHFLSGVAATGSLIKVVVIPEEKLQCLTWWVHLSRHGQLSAAAASGQPEVCGLPGDWFASVEKLREFLKENMASSALPHRPTTVGIQVMAIRGLLSLCKQGADVLETQASFDLILEALTEGSVECKGLAAAIIGVSATQEAQRAEDFGVSATQEVQRAEDFAKAIRPLKQLLLGAHEEAECRVCALGSLLNAALLREQRVLVEFHELLNETPATFTEFLVEQAEAGPTCRCQVLAASLLAQLINMNKVRSTIITGQHERCFALLVERGPTLEVRAAAAGLLWELAYWSRTSQLPEISLRKCVTSLVKSLEQEHAQLARNAAGALASFAYKNKVAKDLITGQANAIPNVVRMLGEDKDPDGQAQACRMLWILADNNAENQARIARADAIPRLAKLLQKLDRQEVLVQAAWAISRLAFKCRDNQEAMASAELQIIPSLVQLLNFKGGESNKAEVVWEKAAQALGDIAKGNETNQEMIAKEEGAVEGLVALLRPEMERQRVPIFAARAVQMLAEGNRGDATVGLKRAASPRLQEILGLPLQRHLRSAVEDALHALDLET